MMARLPLSYRFNGTIGNAAASPECSSSVLEIFSLVDQGTSKCLSSLCSLRIMGLHQFK